MITTFGALKINVDPKTGRGRMVKEDIPAQMAAQTRKRNALIKEQMSAGVLKEHFDSKLEMRYEQYLMCLKFSREITSYIYHPFTVQIAPKKQYTPDFLIESKDGKVTIVELKGGMRMKNVRDSVTRLHVAATKLPMFRWLLVTREKGQWKEREI